MDLKGSDPLKNDIYICKNRRTFLCGVGGVIFTSLPAHAQNFGSFSLGGGRSASSFMHSVTRALSNTAWAADQTTDVPYLTSLGWPVVAAPRRVSGDLTFRSRAADGSMVGQISISANQGNCRFAGGGEGTRRDREDAMQRCLQVSRAQSWRFSGSIALHTQPVRDSADNVFMENFMDYIIDGVRYRAGVEFHNDIREILLHFGPDTWFRSVRFVRVRGPNASSRQGPQ